MPSVVFRHTSPIQNRKTAQFGESRRTFRPSVSIIPIHSGRFNPLPAASPTVRGRSRGLPAIGGRRRCGGRRWTVQSVRFRSGVRVRVLVGFCSAHVTRTIPTPRWHEIHPDRDGLGTLPGSLNSCRPFQNPEQKQHKRRYDPISQTAQPRTALDSRGEAGWIDGGWLGRAVLRAIARGGGGWIRRRRRVASKRLFSHNNLIVACGALRPGANWIDPFFRRGDGGGVVPMADSPAAKSPEIWQEVLGYTNFSSGSSDPRFLRNLDRLFDQVESAGTPPGESARVVHRQLVAKLSELSASSAAFADPGQARGVLSLVFDEVLPAYREHHRDLQFPSARRRVAATIFRRSRVRGGALRRPSLGRDRADRGRGARPAQRFHRPSAGGRAAFRAKDRALCPRARPPDSAVYRRGGRGRRPLSASSDPGTRAAAGHRPGAARRGLLRSRFAR